MYYKLHNFFLKLKVIVKFVIIAIRKFAKVISNCNDYIFKVIITTLVYIVHIWSRLVSL